MAARNAKCSFSGKQDRDVPLDSGPSINRRTAEIPMKSEYRVASDRFMEYFAPQTVRLWVFDML